MSITKNNMTTLYNKRFTVYFSTSFVLLSPIFCTKTLMTHNGSRGVHLRLTYI